MLRAPANPPSANCGAPLKRDPALRMSMAALVASAFVACSAVAAPPALAHIQTGGADDASPLFAPPQVAQRRRQQEDLVRLFEGSPLLQQQQRQQQRGRPPPLTPSSSSAPSSTTAERAREAIAALQRAEAAVDAGDFPLAEREYARVVDSYGDLALSEYARFGRDLVLYERGDATRAIAGLEDSALALRGRAEAHAALASLLYAERPAQLSRAELEFEVASEFDRRFEDADWVAKNRHWPPKALGALRRFLSLG